MVHKLLLADDSVTIQRVIELTFANEDVEVTTVGDGQLAIDRLEAGAFDIVLADVDMPKRDGYQVAAYIKSRPQLAHIPVVLLTGAFEPIDQARATASGSSDVLAKPFEPQMVINRVKQLLGKKPDDSNVEVPSPASFAPPQEIPQDSPQMGNPSPAAKQTPGQGGQPVSLDDYFDQLDAAFSSLQPGTASPEHHEANAIDWASADASDPHVQPNVPQQPQWAEPQKRQAAPTAPPAAPVAVQAPEPLITPVPRAPAQPAGKPEPVVASGRSPQPSPAPPPVPPSPPPVVARPAPAAVAPVAPVAPRAPEPPARPAANPFAELSAAKAEAAARPAAPVITDEVIEEVVARVLQRLSDRIVRETVTEIVAKTAERAVQEEIERIKMGGQ